MSFKIKNSQLTTESLQALNYLIEQDIDANSAYKLSKIVKDLSKIVEFKKEKEKEILEKWTSRDEFGNPLKAKDENENDIEDTILISDIDSFSIDMKKLMEYENEIPHSKLSFAGLNLNTAKVKDILKIDFLFID